MIYYGYNYTKLTNGIFFIHQ